MTCTIRQGVMHGVVRVGAAYAFSIVVIVLFSRPDSHRQDVLLRWYRAGGEGGESAGRVDGPVEIEYGPAIRARLLRIDEPS